ncbi:MAG TPA: filamentous hemagglutinin N-terminal domain-containing protein, partial [Crinalium sp.]
MKRCCPSRWMIAKLIVSELLLWHLVSPSAAIAQIVSDTTLPNHSNVVPTGNGVTINGGTVQGSNLFHSFNQFSVPTGSEAYFNNDGAIANIISRVTGGQVSNIDGLIRANGTANLFLLNPNGIVLGPNARLNIGGAFIASTADSLLFDNDFAFSATNPQAPPLLTINAPIGLQYGSNPGAISSSGSGAQLQVTSGQMLGLLGGDLSLTGVTLSAPQGRIELGSVGPNSTVSLIPRAAGFAAGYEQANQFRDIRLAGQTTVDASGNGSGVIRVRGDRVHLRQASSIISDTLGDSSGGEINITANTLRLDAGSVIASAALGGTG